MFTAITPAPADPVFGVAQQFNEDTHPDKVNLSVGAYRDENGKPVVFDCVKEAGRRMYAEEVTKMSKEYLPMDGSAEFRRVSQELIFGLKSKALEEKRVATVQALSGTGALCILGHFLKAYLPPNTVIYSSKPSWANHAGVFRELLGFEFREYAYWNAAKQTCDIDAMCASLREAPEGSIIILHACAHNPTGQDPSPAQWRQIYDVIKERKHFALLDAAYQGFATADLDKDAFAIRMFDELKGVEFAVAQSYAKNMGLYGERAGCSHIVCQSAEEAQVVQGRLKRFCRIVWSNPPRHGAELATMVLSDPELNASWRAQLAHVSGRITRMRSLLKAGLIKRGTPGNWDHITDQIGMFSYTGLTEAQSLMMCQKHHVYLLKSGRISVAGVNEKNVDHICDAIDDVVRNY